MCLGTRRRDDEGDARAEARSCGGCVAFVRHTGVQLDAPLPGARPRSGTKWIASGQIPAATITPRGTPAGAGSWAATASGAASAAAPQRRSAAYDERLDREVAVAIVVAAGGGDAARARVTCEAQVTGRLGDHPNIITVYDTGEHDGVPFLVLRCMGGGSLASAIARRRRRIGDAIRLGHEVALALTHAHAQRRRAPRPQGPTTSGCGRRQLGVLRPIADGGRAAPGVASPA